ncbi:MAG TPA: Cu(I)-responsive transcriptional regulator [Acetobacteraceae bacterium]|jgi:MerR family transcriptional regulator, copper efflux regulator|nr:Cu(I)-responsive transcriptional regulator [Acetobacteraceae bacterium]
MSLTIGDAATRSGVPAKTIRYYEQIGLIRPAERGPNQYRSYSEADVAMLQFIGRARRLGFSVQELKQLVALYRDHGRASADVKAIAVQHIARIDRKLAELQAVRAALADLAERCHGDTRPDCPILDELAAT